MATLGKIIQLVVVGDQLHALDSDGLVWRRKMDARWEQVVDEGRHAVNGLVWRRKMVARWEQVVDEGRHAVNGCKCGSTFTLCPIHERSGRTETGR